MRSESFSAVHSISPRGEIGLMQIRRQNGAGLRPRYRLGADPINSMKSRRIMGFVPSASRRPLMIRHVSSDREALGLILRTLRAMSTGVANLEVWRRHAAQLPV
jgi:hypothetical protein